MILKPVVVQKSTANLLQVVASLQDRPVHLFAG